jgi:hypothetical protein
MQISPEVLEKELVNDLPEERNNSEREVRCLTHRDFRPTGSHAENPGWPFVQGAYRLNNDRSI